ncbi:MAG: amidohydrolase [Clostridiales bacterium]|nr:amidohydrolase [Clostridiales bacterium]
MMKKADIILINGKIYSVTKNDAVISGQGVAIKDGVIVKVGSNEEIKVYADKNTKTIDCERNTVLPGLCDAHCHPSIAAAVASGCDLFGIYIQEGETQDEIIDKYLQRLKKHIDEHPDDKIIRGAGWVIGNFMGSDVIPTRHDIDKICSDRPVILESFCQHNLWVNTKAIEAAGLDKDTPDVKTGKIYRCNDGYPQGVFNDPEAMAYIKLGVPGYDLTVEEYKNALLWYQQECANKYGVTLVQDCMHSDNARQAYKELAGEGKLTLRIRGVYHLEPDKYSQQMNEFIGRKGKDNSNDDFRIDTVKIFTEGMFNLLEPYEENFAKENEIGETRNVPLYWEDSVFEEYAAKAMEAGFNVHVHAMGDGAVKQAVKCLVGAQHKTELKPRNIIAHLMLVDDEDAITMGKEGIIGNCQPRWMVYDSDINAAVGMMGQERANKNYPFRKFINAGVDVSFGTDFPVTPPPDTMHEIQCAMTRSVFPDAPDYQQYEGRVLGKEKPATLEECIKALSINGAYQMFMEEKTGSIEEGKSADLVILDSDLEASPLDEIYEIRVKKTIFKGKVVFE